jgi:hypothetical protein
MDQSQLQGTGDEQSSPLQDRSGANELLSIGAARAALSFLEETGSEVPQKIRAQIDYIYKDLLRDLGHSPHDNTIVMTADQLRGVVASAVITGAAQIILEQKAELASEPAKETATSPTEGESALEPAREVV